MAQTYRQVAKSVADRKAAHPERYCRARGCLWQTAKLNPERDGYILNADPCRKHPELNTAPSRRARELAEDTFSRIEKSNAAQDAFAKR